MSNNKHKILQDMRVAAAEGAKEVMKKVVEPSKDLLPIVVLDKDGERMFKLVIDHLSESGLLESIDVVTITMLAKNLSMFVMISREIQTVDDIIQYYENGTSNVSGKMTALSKVQGEVQKLSAKLGLSPLDRARILGASVNAANAAAKSAEGDAIDELT
jgi:P27 family predicted phage terminase small subunit